MSDRLANAPPDVVACEAALKKLMDDESSILTVMLAFRDGRPFMVRPRTQPNPGRLAAMSSALSTLSTTVLRELTGNDSDLTLIEGQDGKLLLIPIPAAGRLLMLTVHADGGANLGRLLSYSRHCAASINAAFPAHLQTTAGTATNRMPA